MTKKIFTLLAIMLIIMSANKKLSAGFGTRAVGLPPLGVGYFSSDCFYYNNYFLCNQSIFFANTFLPPDPVPGAFSIVNSNDSKFQSFYNYWGPLVVLGGTSIKFTYKSTVGKTNYYDTEMLSMNYSWGLGIGAGYMLRESPTLASIGTTAVTDVGNGFLYIESFFDLYTELSIDGGTSWIPGSVSRFTLESNCPISTDPCVDLVNEDGTCVPVTHYCQPSTDPCFDNICQNGVCVLFPHICQPLPDPCFINVCKGDGNCYAISQTPTVTAGSNSPVCIGGTMNLTASATDGAGPPYVFSWTGPNGFTSSEQNPVIIGANAANAGIYWVTVHSLNSTCSDSKSTVVEFHSCTQVCQLDAATQTCIGTCPSLYNGDGSIAGSGDCIKKTVTVKGKKVTSCGCGPVYVGSTKCSSVRNKCTGKCDPLYASANDALNKINPINGTCAKNNGCNCMYIYPSAPRLINGSEDGAFPANTLEIFPNPASNQVSINVVRYDGKVWLNVVNILGQKILSKSFDCKGEENYLLDISSLAAGVYKVILTNDSQVSTGAFEKQ